MRDLTANRLIDGLEKRNSPGTKTEDDIKIVVTEIDHHHDRLAVPAQVRLPILRGELLECRYGQMPPENEDIKRKDCRAMPRTQGSQAGA
jgi:hypothetical protein